MKSEAESAPVKPSAKLSGLSFFKAIRSDDALELIRTNPMAYVLASVIAFRARWKRAGFFRHNLKPGEALLGDYESYGMTERQYRTAKQNLADWKFAAFKTTNKGTVGKLIDTRLFSVLENDSDGQNAKRATDGRRTGDGWATTNIDRRKTGLMKNKDSKAPSQQTAPPLSAGAVAGGAEDGEDWK